MQGSRGHREDSAASATGPHPCSASTPRATALRPAAAGMAALPRAFVMLGLLLAAGFLLLMAYMTRERGRRGARRMGAAAVAEVRRQPGHASGFSSSWLAAGMPAFRHIAASWPSRRACTAASPFPHFYRLVDRGTDPGHPGHRPHELPRCRAAAVRPQRRAPAAALSRLPLRRCGAAGWLCLGGFERGRPVACSRYSEHLSAPCCATGLLADPHMLPPAPAGLMIVYLIIAADVLAGHEGAPGLLCDLFGGGTAAGWCADRRLAAGAIALAVIAPLVTPKRLASTAITSWIGLAAVATWAAVTLGLAGAAAVQGKAHAPHLLPDLEAFSGGKAQVRRQGGCRVGAERKRPSQHNTLAWQQPHPRCPLAPQIATQIVAVIPILATAFTCQMTVLCPCADPLPLLPMPVLPRRCAPACPPPDRSPG